MKKKMLSSWEQEIQDANNARKEAIMLNSIEKSMIDSMGYDNKLIIKTGKEIKEKLQSEVQSIAKEKSDCIPRMAILVESIQEPPTKKMYSYYIEKFRKFLTNIPLIYSYEQIYNKSAIEGEVCLESGTIDQPPNASREEKMREYNKLANKFVDLDIDLLKIAMLMRNLEDNREIKLSIDLATQLGF